MCSHLGSQRRHSVMPKAVLEQKTVVVTGANRGLGLEVSCCLLATPFFSQRLCAVSIADNDK